MKSFNGTLKKLMLGTSILGAAVLGGCFMTDSGSKADAGTGTIVVSMGVKDVNNLAKQGLGKSAVAPQGLVLSKLIVTLTSSSPNDSVIRDTLVANDSLGSAFKTTATVAQQVLKSYQVKALRSYTVQVKTLDTKDSVVHLASSTTSVVQIATPATVVLNLSARYVVYVAKFLLPDSLSSTDTTVTGKQKVNIKRLVMVVDGDTVVDSVSSGYFAADPVENFIVWPYVKADTTHTVGLYVYTDSLGNWDPTRPLYGTTVNVTSTDSTYAPSLPWTGPGSPSDPNYNPANPGGSQADLEINLGPVSLVEINPSTGGAVLPRRK